MPRTAAGTSAQPLVDVLDRVLTKGIVILYEIDVSIAGLRVVEITGRTVVLSLETYTKMTEPPPAADASDALMDAVTAYLKRLPGGDLPEGDLSGSV